MYFRKHALVIAVAGVLLVVLAAPLFAQGKFLTPYDCPPCDAIANAFVRADVSPSGLWAMGTTGGDPSTPGDDGKRLIYRFEPGGTSHMGSGYATVRMTGVRGSVDAIPSEAETTGTVTTTSAVSTTWSFTSPYRVRVIQTLSLAPNPFSGRDDVVQAAYAATNQDTVSVEVGLRALIDVMIGDNDGAPYQVPGLGAITFEREFLGDDVPPFWLAFESETLDPAQVRSVGILDSAGLTRPDRFVIASWRHIKGSPWMYAVNPSQSVVKPNDSAVALYWDELLLAPGATRRVSTKYGLAGQGGGNAFLTAENPQCGTSFPVSMFVTNFDTVPLTGGQATLNLPMGLVLSAGQSATKAMATIDPGSTGSVVWTVDVGAAVSGGLTIRADAAFDGNVAFQAERTILVTCQPAPVTPTSTSTVGPTATPSATPSPPPTALPTPTTAPTRPTPSSCAQPCTYVKGRVPDQVISDALTSPDGVIGWGLRANPNRPPSPYNPPRCFLSLLNINVPYNVLHNPVVYKAGCP